MAFLTVNEIFRSHQDDTRRWKTVINTAHIIRINRLGIMVEANPGGWRLLKEEEKDYSYVYLSQGGLIIDSPYDDFLKMLKDHDR